MHISATRDALALMKAEIASRSGADAAVVIVRGPSSADLKRGPLGEVVWSNSRNQPAWLASVVLGEWPPDFEQVELDGIKFVLLAPMGPAERCMFRIRVKRGKLYATRAA